MAARSDPRELVAAAGRPGDLAIVPVEDKQLLRVVSLWWWMLPVVGIPAWVGALAAGGAMAAGGWILWRTAGEAERRSGRRRARLISGG